MCVAVAAKKLSRDVMYTVGVAVIGLQALNHFGYVTINWNAIEKDVVRAVDQDGDEKISKEDAMRPHDQILESDAGRACPTQQGSLRGSTLV